MAGKGTRLFASNAAGWAMAGPAFGLIVLFIIVPFILAFTLSLTNARLFSPNPVQWVGGANFQQLLGVRFLTLEPQKDEAGAIVLDAAGEPSFPRLREYTRNSPDYPQLQGMQEFVSFDIGQSRTHVLARNTVFLQAIVNTLLFVLIVAPVQGGLALGLALLVNQKLKGIKVFRVIYFMPVVVSIVVVSLLWRFIYDGNNGLLNSLLSWLTFGLSRPVDWIGNPSTALFAIIVMSIWQAVGFHMVIWLAGLQTIPPTLYEAASIEGASRCQTFRYVTWPGLRNTATLVLIVITMQAFGLFSQVDVMTKGGPLDSTQSLVFQAVEVGYRKQDIGTGSAISVILFGIVLSITLILRRLTREGKV